MHLRKASGIVGTLFLGCALAAAVWINREESIDRDTTVPPNRFSLEELKLQPSSSQSLASNNDPHSSDNEKPCDAECQQQKAEIETRMKALRDMIDSDFSDMIHFGKKAGYLPPPKSIEQQVRDGTLMGFAKDNLVAPPPFSGNSLISSLPDATKPLPLLTANISSPEAAAPAQNTAAAASNGSPASAPRFFAAAVSPIGHDLGTAGIDGNGLDSAAAAGLGANYNSGTDAAAAAAGEANSRPGVGGGRAGQSSIPAWDKAFAFMNHVDAPLAGSRPAAGGGGGGGGSPAAGAEGAADGWQEHDPLKNGDAFLQNFLIP